MALSVVTMPTDNHMFGPVPESDTDCSSVFTSPSDDSPFVKHHLHELADTNMGFEPRVRLGHEIPRSGGGDKRAYEPLREPRRAYDTPELDFAVPEYGPGFYAPRHDDIPRASVLHGHEAHSHELQSNTPRVIQSVLPALHGSHTHETSHMNETHGHELQSMNALPKGLQNVNTLSGPLRQLHGHVSSEPIRSMSGPPEAHSHGAHTGTHRNVTTVPTRVHTPTVSSAPPPSASLPARTHLPPSDSVHHLHSEHLPLPEHLPHPESHLPHQEHLHQVHLHEEHLSLSSRALQSEAVRPLLPASEGVRPQLQRSESEHLPSEHLTTDHVHPESHLPRALYSESHLPMSNRSLQSESARTLLSPSESDHLHSDTRLPLSNSALQSDHLHSDHLAVSDRALQHSEGARPLLPPSESARTARSLPESHLPLSNRALQHSSDGTITLLPESVRPLLRHSESARTLPGTSRALPEVVGARRPLSEGSRPLLDTAGSLLPLSESARTLSEGVRSLLPPSESSRTLPETLGAHIPLPEAVGPLPEVLGPLLPPSSSSITLPDIVAPLRPPSIVYGPAYPPPLRHIPPATPPDLPPLPKSFPQPPVASRVVHGPPVIEGVYIDAQIIQGEVLNAPVIPRPDSEPTSMLPPKSVQPVSTRSGLFKEAVGFIGPPETTFGLTMSAPFTHPPFGIKHIVHPVPFLTPELKTASAPATPSIPGTPVPKPPTGTLQLFPMAVQGMTPSFERAYVQKSDHEKATARFPYSQPVRLFDCKKPEIEIEPHEDISRGFQPGSRTLLQAQGDPDALITKATKVFPPKEDDEDETEVDEKKPEEKSRERKPFSLDEGLETPQFPLSGSGTSTITRPLRGSQFEPRPFHSTGFSTLSQSVSPATLLFQEDAWEYGKEKKKRKLE